MKLPQDGSKLTVLLQQVPRGRGYGIRHFTDTAANVSIEAAEASVALMELPIG